MGGAQTLYFASHGPATTRALIRGYLAESPLISLSSATRPNAAVVWAGKLAAKILPHRQMKNVLDAQLLSRDEAVQRAFVEDELCHDTGTLEGLAGMLDRAAKLEGGEVKIGKEAGEGGRTREWVGHGTEDGVCDFGGTRAWFEREVGGTETEGVDGEFRGYEGWRHKCEFFLCGFFSSR